MPKIISKQDDASRVYVADESGQIGSVSRDELQGAVSSGMRPATAEEVADVEAKSEAESLGGYAQTVGLGAARGATFGLSDVAVDALGGAEKARELQRYNPTLSTVSEVGGAIAPALLTGGSSAGVTGTTMAARGLGAMSRAARFLPAGGSARLGMAAEQLTGRGLARLGVAGEGLGARMLQKGAQLGASGAIEGGLYGAGQTLSEAALSGGDYDNLAERMLAGGWRGAKEGALMGAGLGAGLGAGSKALDKFGSKLKLPDAGAYAEEQAMRALGARGTDLKRLAKQGGVAKVSRELLDATLDDGTRVVAKGDTTGQIASKIDKAVDESMSKLEKMRSQVDDIANKSPELAPDGATLFRKLDELAEAGGTTPSMARRWKKALKEVEPLRQKTIKASPVAQADGTMTYPLRFKELNDYRKALDSVIFPKAKAGIATVPKSQAELLAVRQVIEETLSDSAERALKESGSELAGSYADTKRRVSGLLDAKKIATRDAALDLGASPMGITEKLTSMGGIVASAATGGIAPMVAGGLVSAGKKAFRERGFSTLARIADDVSKSDKKIGSSLKAFFKQADEKIGGGRRRAIGIAAGRDDKTPAQRSLGAKGKESALKAYDRRTDEIRQFNADPVVGAERAIGDLAVDAPQTATALASTVARGQAFLASKIPTPPAIEGSMFPAIDRPEPSGEEMARFGRYVEAVDSPLSVLDHLRDGTITAEHVEALQTVYPSLYGDLKMGVHDQLVVANEKGEKLPYDRRVLLGVLLDMPTDPSLLPGAIRSSQEGYAASREQQPPSGQTPPPAGQLGKASMTQAQALEAGEFSI